MRTEDERYGVGGGGGSGQREVYEGESGIYISICTFDTNPTEHRSTAIGELCYAITMYLYVYIFRVRA